MKIETLKKSKLKYFLCALVLGIILIIILDIKGSLAKYKTTESINIANGTINYSPSDLSIMGIYIESDNGYIETDTIPESGYQLNSEESYCKVGDTELEVTINYDSSNKSLSISPFINKGTKCYLYFAVLKGITIEDIIATKTISARTLFAKTIISENTTGTMYSAVDEDETTSYYYAGEVDDNWIFFAGYYWRIIRINGDGSMRIIYNGTTTDQTGETTQLSEMSFDYSENDNAYLGYMHGSSGASNYASTHTNTTSSAIKVVVDEWYESNIKDTIYENYIDTNAGFCGDRTAYTDNAGTTSGGGYGTTVTYYGAYNRFQYQMYSQGLSTASPTYLCSNDNDLYTTSSSSKGNKALTYPIGLITADEISYAGGHYGIAYQNTSVYLCTDQEYWTISPFRFTGSYAAVITFGAGGFIRENTYNSHTGGVRPVINLRSDIELTGSGTSTDPYIVVGAE